MTQSAPQSAILDGLDESVYRAATVLAGLHLDLFTQLEDGPQSVAQIADAIQVVFNLVFLNIYQGGQGYTEQEHRDSLTEAGFEDIKRVMSDVMVARKPAP